MSLQLRTGAIEELNMPAFLRYAAELYNVRLSKQVREAGEALSYYAEEGVASPQVDAESYRRTLRTALVKQAGLSKPTGFKALPDFPEELPRNYFFTNEHSGQEVK